MITIKQAVSDLDIHEIASLANIIWHEHFTPLIGTQQVRYMLDKFQSFDAIKDAVINEGYQYYMAYAEDQFCAYMGIHPENDGKTVFVSKLYVEKAYRGRKISKQLLAEIFIRFPSCKTLWLTVNKHNSNTIAAYEKMGFIKARTQCSDIGGGFVMDDYIMEKNR